MKIQKNSCWIAYMVNYKNYARYSFMFMWNSLFCKLPSYKVRYYILKYIYRANLGKCTIHRNVTFFSPWKLKVGDNSNIQMGTFIDCRGGVEIGNNVDITLGVKILSQYHDINSSDYKTVSKQIIISDYCILGSYCLVLPGASLYQGAVLGAGSVLTKYAKEYSLYCGNPAELKKPRSSNLSYDPYYKRPFH